MDFLLCKTQKLLPQTPHLQSSQHCTYLVSRAVRNKSVLCIKPFGLQYSVMATRIDYDNDPPSLRIDFGMSSDSDTILMSNFKRGRKRKNSREDMAEEFGKKKWASDIVHKKRAIQSTGSLDIWQLSQLERSPGTESIQLSSPEGITVHLVRHGGTEPSHRGHQQNLATHNSTLYFPPL